VSFSRTTTGKNFTKQSYCEITHWITSFQYSNEIFMHHIFGKQPTVYWKILCFWVLQVQKRATFHVLKVACPRTI
jgi:hypothetical protein